jgi:ATP-dependent RNA helicase SUPV3L1/SUV3
VAEVNDKGEVTVEGNSSAGWRASASSRTRAPPPTRPRRCGRPSPAGAAPQFHLRADRFYNAPDTEIDFTEQGGLMWGEHAVGKLVPGADPLKPRSRPSSTTRRAGCRREGAAPAAAFHRPQDRRAVRAADRLQRDEALTGLARGFAFRLVEALGILPRALSRPTSRRSTRTRAARCASTACASGSSPSSCRCC